LAGGRMRFDMGEPRWIICVNRLLQFLRCGPVMNHRHNQDTDHHRIGNAFPVPSGGGKNPAFGHYGAAIAQQERNRMYVRPL
jgi:hypothetical protein